MKKFLILLTLISFGTFCLFSLLVLPYIAYFLTIENQLPFNWFIHKENRENLIAGKDYVTSERGDLSVVNDRYYKLLHVGNYRLQVPLEHPLYQVLPVIKEGDKKDFLQLGFTYVTYQQKKIAEVIFNEGNRFLKELDSQKIFKSPLMRSQLENLDISLLWRDIFTKDLKGYDKLNKMLGLTYSELLYNLYILHLRYQLFPPDTNSFSYSNSNGFGIIEYGGPHHDFRQEIVLMLVDGMIESFHLSTRFNDTSATDIRRNLIESSAFLLSSKEEAKIMYNQFLDLNYQSKIGPSGMLYLFSAWSHKTQDVEFLREVIHYLERGDNNLLQLNPLFSYAFRRYGAGFSGQRKESVQFDDQEKKLEELVVKEDQVNMPDDQDRQPAEEDDTFEGPQDRMNSYLLKAKELKMEKERGRESLGGADGTYGDESEQTFE